MYILAGGIIVKVHSFSSPFVDSVRDSDLAMVVQVMLILGG